MAPTSGPTQENDEIPQKTCESMVGLATQPSDAHFNEEHTRAPREVGENGLHCEHCMEPVRHQNMQVVRDKKVTCHDCYNLNYRGGEAGISKKQFQRLSGAEFGLASLTLRAAMNPKRTSDVVSQAIATLEESEKKRLSALVMAPTSGPTQDNAEIPQKMPPHQAVWTCVDADGTLVHTSPIILHKEEKGKRGRFQGITFGGNYRANGRWMYMHDTENDAVYMMLEFAAASTGYPRRHVLRQVTADVFELLATTHPLYAMGIWTTGSLKHTNKGNVYMRTWTHPNVASLAADASNTFKKDSNLPFFAADARNTVNRDPNQASLVADASNTVKKAPNKDEEGSETAWVVVHHQTV